MLKDAFMKDMSLIYWGNLNKFRFVYEREHRLAFLFQNTMKADSFNRF